MAKRECLPVHTVPPSLVSQLWLSWFIDSFYVRVFLADPYKSSGDIGGWDGLDCAFCNRPGISENSWVPHWKGASDKPFLHPTKSLKATTKLQIIDGSPSSQGIQNVEPFFLFLTRKRSQDKLKEAKRVGWELSLWDHSPTNGTVSGEVDARTIREEQRV